MTWTSTIPEPPSRATEPSEQLRRILVPLDGFAASEAILPLVEPLAREPAVSFRLVRTVGAATQRPSEADGGSQASLYLARIGDQLRERGLHRIFQSVRHAEPGHGILRAAIPERRRRHRRRRAWRERRRPPTARARGCSPADARPHAGPPVARRVRGLRPGAGVVLVPLSSSPASRDILPVVARLARAGDRPIVLLRAVEPRSVTTAGTSPMEREGESKRRAAEAELAELAQRLQATGLRVRSFVRIAPAIDLILAVANEEPAGLIAMAPGRWARLGSDPFGPVAAPVLAQASVPAFVWRGYRP